MSASTSGAGPSSLRLRSATSEANVSRFLTNQNSQVRYLASRQILFVQRVEVREVSKVGCMSASASKQCFVECSIGILYYCDLRRSDVPARDCVNGGTTGVNPSGTWDTRGQSPQDASIWMGSVTCRSCRGFLGLKEPLQNVHKPARIISCNSNRLSAHMRRRQPLRDMGQPGK